MTRDEDELRGLFQQLAERQTPRGTDGGWLKERLRRRRARQGVAAGALAVLAVAGVAFGATVPGRDDDGATVAQLSASPTPSPTEEQSPSPEPSEGPRPSPAPPIPPPLMETTGARLVVAQGTHLEVLDVDTGARTAIPTDPRLANYDRIDVLAVGAQLVFLGDDQTGAGNGPNPAYATTTGPGSPLRAIGEASDVQPSDRAGRVWLESISEGTGSRTTLTEVDLTGHVHRHASLNGTFGAEPFAGGYLRRSPTNDKDTELADSTGHVSHRYPDTDVITVSDSAAVLASRVGCEQQCQLHVLTAGAGVTEHTVTINATALDDVGLTRDASRLFVAARRGGDGAPPLMLSEIDLGTGRTRPAPDAWAAPYYGPSLRFSRDGRWMFFTDGDLKSVDAYDLTNRRAYRLKGTFDVITQLELVP